MAAMLLVGAAAAYVAPSVASRLAHHAKAFARVTVLDDNRTGYVPYISPQNGRCLVEQSYEGCYVYALHIESMGLTVAFTEGLRGQPGQVYVARGRVLGKSITDCCFECKGCATAVEHLNRKPRTADLAGMFVRYRHPKLDSKEMQCNRFDAIRVGTRMHGVVQHGGGRGNRAYVFSAPGDLDNADVYLAVRGGRASDLGIELVAQLEP